MSKDWSLTNWYGGQSGFGRTSVWGNNNILPEEEFRRRHFIGGTARRFGSFNKVVLEEEEEEEVTYKRKKYEGALYVHGKNTLYYSGDIFFDTESERFSSEFGEIAYPKFSDAITLRRLSTSVKNAGLVMGSIENEQVFYPYDKAVCPAGSIIIKRFEYQSITKSSLDQDSKWRRDKNYYSMVFQELYEKGIPLEFQKEFCCSQCGQYYYTGELMPETDSVAFAYTKGTDSTGHWYTVDTKHEREVTNTLHEQYIEIEEIDNLKNYKTIQNIDADITKHDYDYRIMYYPKNFFGTSRIYAYQGSKGINNGNWWYGLVTDSVYPNGERPLTVEEYVKNNDYSYSSYLELMATITATMSGSSLGYEGSEWYSFKTREGVRTQIQRDTRHYENYKYEAGSWHSSKGTEYSNRQGLYEYAGYSKGTNLSQYVGYFYGNNNDCYSRFCEYMSAFYAGSPHSGAGGDVPTTSSMYGHHVSGFNAIDFAAVDCKWGYLTQKEDGTEQPGEFLPDYGASVPLEPGDLTYEGLNPRDETEGVPELPEEQVEATQLVDPFEVSYLANFASKEITREVYIPHVFTNRQEYEEIKPNEERLVNYDEHYLQYETVILTTKTDSGTGEKGFVKVTMPAHLQDDPFMSVNIGNELYKLEQKYTTKSNKAGSWVFGIYTNTWDDPDGYKKIPVKDKSKGYTLGGEYINKADLPQSPRFDANVGGFDGDGFRMNEGRQFRDVKQRYAHTHGEYSFFSISTGIMYDERMNEVGTSVFNDYIYTNFLPDPSGVYEVEIGRDDHKFENTTLEEDIPPFFTEYTEDEMRAISQQDMEKWGHYTITIQVTKKSGVLNCGSKDSDPGDSGLSFCEAENETVSFPPRSVTYVEPWELLKSDIIDGERFETYGISLWDNDYELKGHYPYRISDEYIGHTTNYGDVVNPEPKKKDTPESISPVFLDAKIPNCYYQYFTAHLYNSSGYTEQNVWLAPEGKFLEKKGNGSPAFLRPWSSSLLTYYGCCPKRASNKYFLFGSKAADANAAGFVDSYDDPYKNPWDYALNKPEMQNRFHKTGTTYINFMVEGIHPLANGNFAFISPLFSDFEEGFSGIQLKTNGLTNLADGKFGASFSTPCDTAMVAESTTDGTINRDKLTNIFCIDTESSTKYTVNKGFFPILKGLIQPDNFTNFEYVLFGIETQCLIEGPNYYFSRSKSDYPPGFDPLFNGYLSRGLMIAVCSNGQFKTYKVNANGFFDYFEEQNKKRDKLNFRRAYDSHPEGMRKEEGYYWDCEEAFGIYEIASPYTFETQLAGKMSFVVKVGEKDAVIFLLAYDIDKWPCSKEDEPKFDKSHPEIYEDEQYAFKSAYCRVTLKDSYSDPVGEAFDFKDFTLKSVFRKLSTKKKYSNRQLKKMGKKYFEDKKKEIVGIVVCNKPKNGYYDGIPEYVLDEKKKTEEDLECKRGIVQLIRWRTFNYETPERDKQGDIKYKDNEIVYEKCESAIAECAISYEDPRKSEDLRYYVGKKTVFVHFSKKAKGEFEVQCLHIPEQMVWYEDISTPEQISKGERNYKEHLLELTRIGIFDIVTCQKKKKEGEPAATAEEKFDILAVPVMAKDGKTYLCVSKDCENWEISGEIGNGYLSHSCYGESAKDETK